MIFFNKIFMDMKSNLTPMPHFISRLVLLLVCVGSLSIGAAVLPSCSGGLNMYGTDTDAQLGKQMDDEIRKNTAEYPILNNPAARQYIQSMINDIVKAPQVEYRGKFPYIAEVIQDDKTINAFCTPGGYIYVYTGLIKALDNEATLAGVLGHEIAHAERRHGTQRMTKAYGLQMLTQIALGQNPSQIATLGANLFGGLALLKNSRTDEEDADSYSFKYLQSTRWYAGSIKFFFEKITAQKNATPGNAATGSSFVTTVERLLSTHPLPQDRIDATNKRIADANLPQASEGNLFGQKYQQFKRTLP
jgi:beta-barrel assembly-enhancing protease